MTEKQNLFGVEKEFDSKYSVNVDVPQYLPKNECPNLFSCVDTRKYNKLLHNISVSNVSEEEKEFLKLAATRHLIFTYSLIADYYAHASKEMQTLMEESALVIIDFDDAIANGYVKLSSRIYEIAKQSKNLKRKLEKYNQELD